MSCNKEKNNREERIKKVKEAFQISEFSGNSISEFAINLSKQYIEGEKEIDQIQEEIIKKYKKGDCNESRL